MKQRYLWLLGLLLWITPSSWAQDDFKIEFEIPKGATPLKGPGLIQLTLFHTGDMHGHAWPLLKPGQPESGGLAALYSLVLPELRRAQIYPDETVLLLDAGNFSLGSPPNDVMHAQPMLSLMNGMGYHGVAVGPLEFSRGLAFLKNLQAHAQFPLLAANAFLTDGYSQTPLTHPYVILEQDNLRIGIVGLLDPRVNDSVRFLIPHLKIEDPIKTARKIENELHHRVDMIIALSSLGLRPDPTEPQKGQRDAITLAKATRYIDVIINSTPTLPPAEALDINGTLIVQTPADTQYVGVLTLALDPQHQHRIVRYTDRLLPINVTRAHKTPTGTSYYPVWKHIVPDPTLNAQLQVFQNQLQSLRYQHMGISKVDVPHTALSPLSSPLGNLLTDILRSQTRCDVAWIPNQAVISGFAAGPLTLGHLWALTPPTQSLITGKISGYGLKKVVEHLLTLHPQHPDFLQMSGLKVTQSSPKKPVILVADQPLQLSQTYSVTTVSTIATPTWVPHLQDHLQERIVLNQTLTDVIIDYFRQQPILSQVDTQPRLTF